MEFALIRSSTGELLETRNFAAPPEPLSLPHKDRDWRPLTRVKPAHDPASQVMEGPVTSVNAESVQIAWTVRAKTAQEIDADKAAIVAALFDDALKAVATALFEVVNDVRALKGQQTITAQQFRDYLKGKL